MTKYELVGGGWEGTSRTGDSFVRIKLLRPIEKPEVLTMYRNKNKNNELQPDFKLFVPRTEVSNGL